MAEDEDYPREGGQHGLDVADQEESYDLHDRTAFAKFLIDADIRLVRGRFFKKLYRDGLKLPRRQEADSMTVGLLLSPALVRHEEVKIWAEAEEIEEKTQDLDHWEIAARKAARKAKIVAVSHVWESREHADPHGYQLRKLAEVVEVDSWYFYDYISLYQFKRSVASQEKSFRRAMANMHVLYAHEHSSTLRIESLTPLDEMHMDATVFVYHAPSNEVKPIPVANLIANRTRYRDRGWCIAELCWSSTRSLGSLSKEIDEAEADTDGQAPMPPEIFVPLFKEKLQFTHRSDMDAVLKLQERVFHEKAQKNQILKLKKLSRAEAEVAIQALPHYPGLHRLDITRSRLGDVESFFLALFEALDSKSSITELCLADNELGVKGAMFVIRKVLDKNAPLSMLDLKKNGITEEGAKMLAEALLQHPDAALKIELDGNNLGAGALILALALKFCQEQVTLVHPSVELLAKSIKALDFDKAIVGEGCQSLGDGLSKLLHLTSLSLDLGRNHVGDGECQSLGDGLSKLLQLTSLALVLRSNNVGAGGCRALGDGLSKLLHLTSLSLDLEHNNVGDGGCQSLGDGLSKLLQLTSLALLLGYNNVGVQGCQSLGNGLSKLLQLTSMTLDLAVSNFGDGGCQSLGDGLSKLIQLTRLSLNLAYNKAGPEGCQSLGDGLSKLIQLTSLSLKLAYNNAGPKGCQSLGDGLSKLLHLTSLSLDLENNNVGDGECQSLGDGLSKLIQLTRLSLDLTNNFVGSVEGHALTRKLQHVAELEICYDQVRRW